MIFVLECPLIANGFDVEDDVRSRKAGLTMPYPEGLIIFGLPIILLAFGVERAIRKVVRDGNGKPSFHKERMLKLLTMGITLAILTALYFLMQS